MFTLPFIHSRWCSCECLNISVNMNQLLTWKRIMLLNFHFGLLYKIISQPFIRFGTICIVMYECFNTFITGLRKWRASLDKKRNIQLNNSCSAMTSRRIFTLALRFHEQIFPFFWREIELCSNNKWQKNEDWFRKENTNEQKPSVKWMNLYKAYRQLARQTDVWNRSQILGIQLQVQRFNCISESLT